MKEIRLFKVTVNVGAGEAGTKLEKAQLLIAELTGNKVVITKTHKRTTFGSPKGRPIGCKVTLRGKSADAFLKRALEAIDNKISGKAFDTQGNFSFGIKEHIDLPDVKYDPNTGIYGMDICVTLERKGFRVARKRIKSKIGKNHLITPEESKKWLSEKFGVVIE